MEKNPSKSSLNKLREQYDTLPYPIAPIKRSVQEDYNLLFTSSLITSNYLAQKRIIDTKDKIILDAGCGSGWVTLALAQANPEAKIVCIDLSINSLQVAEERLTYHGFNEVEYHQLAIENLPQLDYQYDYINCDNVLYFSDDPVVTLKHLNSVLKPQGIIRANLHSYYQRFNFYRAQKLFQIMGLFDENPEDLEIETVIETMKNLKDSVNLKVNTWSPLVSKISDWQSDKGKEAIRMNYLIQNDKGYTIPQTFEMLRDSNLEFLSMLNWQHWDVRNLFKDESDLPWIWEMGLENCSLEDSLHIYELLHPYHRTIDFWCTQKSDRSEESAQPIISWNDNDWESALIYLHPQLKSTTIKNDLIESIKNKQLFPISKYIFISTLNPLFIETHFSALLLKLWDNPLSLSQLTEIYLQIQPVNLITLESLTIKEVRKILIDFILRLESSLYLLVRHLQNIIIDKN